MLSDRAYLLERVVLVHNLWHVTCECHVKVLLKKVFFESAGDGVCRYATILSFALKSRMKCAQLFLVDRSTLECVFTRFLSLFFFFCLKQHCIAFVQHTLPQLLHPFPPALSAVWVEPRYNKPAVLTKWMRIGIFNHIAFLIYIYCHFWDIMWLFLCHTWFCCKVVSFRWSSIVPFQGLQHFI